MAGAVARPTPIGQIDASGIVTHRALKGGRPEWKPRESPCTAAVYIACTMRPHGRHKVMCSEPRDRRKHGVAHRSRLQCQDIKHTRVVLDALTYESESWRTLAPREFSDGQD